MRHWLICSFLLALSSVSSHLPISGQSTFASRMEHFLNRWKLHLIWPSSSWPWWATHANLPLSSSPQSTHWGKADEQNQCRNLPRQWWRGWIYGRFRAISLRIASCTISRRITRVVSVLEWLVCAKYFILSNCLLLLLCDYILGYATCWTWSAKRWPPYDK